MEQLSSTSEMSRLLDDISTRLRTDITHAGAALQLLAEALRTAKRQLPPDDWSSLMAAARLHPLRALVHQDPLSLRAYTRPRGYQGDAQLLDVIYRKDFTEVHPHEPSDLGKAIFAYTIECKAPSAVRTRREVLAQFIDEVTNETEQADILSVACGHLREVHSSKAIKQKTFGRFVGLDQDSDCLQVVARELGPLGVETLHGSVKLLLNGQIGQQRFDFIYAAGLFDYLEERFAQKVAECMFYMLNPGGRLLLANYLPDIEDVGYMETYMGWTLIYRSLREIESLLERVAPSELGQIHTFTDADKQIGYLALRRQ